MPTIINFRQGDELPAQAAVTLTDDDTGDFWAGAQKSFAGLAITVALTATLLSSAVASWTAVAGDEQVPAQVAQPVVEDYWALARPAPASIYLRLPLAEQEEIPAGSLFGQPDEDYWINWVAPVPASVWQRLPLGDPEELPAGQLFGGDEEYWLQGVQLVQTTGCRSLPLVVDSSAEELPAQPVDEDYWQWGAVPVQASVCQPSLFTVDTSGENASVQPVDEDYWFAPISTADSANAGYFGLFEDSTEQQTPPAGGAGTDIVYAPSAGQCGSRSGTSMVGRR